MRCCEKYCRFGQATYVDVAHVRCYWKPKVQTHSEYVIVIVCPLEQWLQEHASMLRYMCTVCDTLPLFPTSGRE